MNTKPIPAMLALAAGFVTCVLSFVQRVDSVVFAKRFIVVCLAFYVIGAVIAVVLHMNFKEMEDVVEDAPAEEGIEEDSMEDAAEDIQEDGQEAEESEE